MGTIDNLNFKIILDDKDFNEQVKKDLDLAKSLNVELSQLIDFKKKSAVATKEMASAVKSITSSLNAQVNVQRNLNSAIADGSRETERQSALMKTLKEAIAAYFSVDAARRFVSELVRVTGEFEKQRVALGAILQDSSAGDALFDRIKNLAVESPFSVRELTSYAKQLTAFSIPLDEIYDTTKMLADVSAGLGVDMSRIVLAYGQIRSASFLRGQEVRQLTEAGIPILEELSKQFQELEGRAVSVNEVFDKISARQVPFEMVEKAFVDMTSEGGKFYNMQEVLAETLAGKISNLRDAYEIMLSDIGNANSGVLKVSVDLLTELLRSYDKIGIALVSLASGYGTYKVVVYAADIATKGLVKSNIALAKSFIRVKNLIKAHPYAMIAAAAISAATAIYQVVKANGGFYNSQKKITDSVRDSRAEFDAEISKLDILWDKLKKAKVGTKEYEDVRSQIVENYGNYLSNVDLEALKIGNLAGVYDNLTKSIKESAKEKAMNAGMDEINADYSKKIIGIYKNVSQILGNASEKTRKQILSYIKGESNYSDLSDETKASYFPDKQQAIPNFVNPLYGLRDKFKSVKEDMQEAQTSLEEAMSLAFGEDSKRKKKPVNPTDYNAANKALEERIALVKEMASLYSKMKDAGISDKTIREKFDEIYSEKDKSLYSSFDFDQTLAELESQLAKSSSAVAKSAEAALRKDKINEFTDAFKESSTALQKWVDFYNKIEETMPESSDDSFGARVQGVLNKLELSNYKNSKSADDALSNLADSEAAKIEEIGKEAWLQYSNDGMDAISRWKDAAIQANVDVAQQSLQSLGKTYLDTFFTSQGINMNDLNDKSFGQLQSMLDKLNEVDSDNLIPASVVSRAKQLGVNIKPMLDFITQAINTKKQDILGAMLGNITEMANASRASLEDVESSLKRIAELKRTISYKKGNGLDAASEEKELTNETILLKQRLKSPYAYMNGIAKATETAAKYMKEFAQATGDSRLDGAANALSAISQNLSAAAQGGASGGWIGAVVAGVTDALGQITSAVIESKTAIVKTANAMEKFQKQIYMTKFSVNEDDYETIFGVKTIAKASDAYRKARAAMAEYRKAITAKMEKIDTIGEYKYNVSAMEKKWNEAYEKGYTNLEGMLVMTKHSNSIRRDILKKPNEYAALKDIVPELFDEDGFNLENAKIFLENKDAIRYWNKYNKGVVEAIQHVVELAEANEKAAEILDNAVTDMFGDMSSEFTDIIFDAVINGSDAWTQFKEKGSEAILDLGKQLMRETLITEYFDQFSQRIKDAYGLDSPDAVYSELANVMSDIYGGMESLAPYWEQMASQWVSMMESSGFDTTSSSSSLSNGIKSITESTANLLASYLNAIRSDVSQIRAMQASANDKMEKLLDVFPKTPTLADYLTKIEAHTANISADTSAILKQLRSVITTQGGSAAFSVYM